MSLKHADRPVAAPQSSQALPRSRYILFFSIATCGCATDLLSKHVVFKWLGEPSSPHAFGRDNTWWLWEGYFGFQTAVNTGALFGLGKGGSPFFAGLSVVAAVGIVVWLFVARAAHDRFLTIALGCVTGGILGNLYDRLGLWNSSVPEHEYGVRDWILMQIPGYPPWPNYNIADSLLVCGAAMLMFHAFWYRSPEESDEQAKADTATG